MTSEQGTNEQGSNKQEAADRPCWIDLEGGAFTMGSDNFYADEAPVREAHVESFSISMTPVTNRQFAAFVAATRYLTAAEQPLPRAQFPQLAEADRAPGSLVFTPTAGPVDLADWRQWWRWVPGASWRRPRGEGTGPDAGSIPTHPVVQIAYPDAIAYAEWCGGRLPTEAELEYAACGGVRPAPYAWGATRDVDGQVMANTWRGSFPYRNTGAKGWIGTSPVGTFAPNGYGLHDTIGNVWEWTTTRYEDAPTPEAPQAPGSTPQALPTTPRAEREAPASTCQCSPARSGLNAQPEPAHSAQVHPAQAHPAQAQRAQAQPGQSLDGERFAASVRRVLKGGSHLCAPEYCLRYRPAARSPQSEDSATTHIGFRVVRDAG